MEKILNEFENYLTLNSIASKSNYLISVKEFLNYLNNENQALERMNKNILSEYRAFLLSEEKQKALSRQTVNNKLNRIKKFLRFLYKKKYTNQNLGQNFKGLKVGEVLPKNILSADEMKKLLDNFSIMNKSDSMLLVLIHLLYGSALRINEAESLQVEDVDFMERTITITDRKDNDKRKTKPATQQSLKILKSYLHDNAIDEGYIFCQQAKTTLRCLLNRKLKSECKRLNLKPITSHSFRHSIATQVLRKGAGVREVQEFLGHRNIRNTEIYTRVVKEDLKNMIGKFHPREVSHV